MVFPLWLTSGDAAIFRGCPIIGSPFPTTNPSVTDCALLPPPAARRTFSGLQGLVQKRQARVHPVVDVRVVVVEFLLAMPDAGGGGASGGDGRAVGDWGVGAPGAVDVQGAKRPGVIPIYGDHVE